MWLDEEGVVISGDATQKDTAVYLVLCQLSLWPFYIQDSDARHHSLRYITVGC